MRAAGYKKSPRVWGGQRANGQIGDLASSIDKNRENVKLPAWIEKKLGRIAARQEDFGLFEEQATIILAAECKAYPDIAEGLSERFRAALMHQRADVLDHIERAAIAIIAAEAAELADIFSKNAYRDFFDLKVRALCMVLQEGEGASHD